MSNLGVNPDVASTQHAPSLRITSFLLNGNNFHYWSRSLRLFVGLKGKTGWLLGTEKQLVSSDTEAFSKWEADCCTILGWIFNSMEECIYSMFMFYKPVSDLWSALTQMYAHAHNDARIFELYREIYSASQESLNLSMADYFGYLMCRWEELAQYEPFNDFHHEDVTLTETSGQATHL